MALNIDCLLHWIRPVSKTRHQLTSLFDLTPPLCARAIIRYRESGFVRVRAYGNIGLVPDDCVRLHRSAVPPQLVQANAGANTPPGQNRVRAASVKFQTSTTGQWEDGEERERASSDASFKVQKPKKSALKLKNKVRAASVQFQTPASSAPLAKWNDTQVLAWLMEDGDTTQEHYETIKRARWRGADLAAADDDTMALIGIDDPDTRDRLLAKVRRLKGVKPPPQAGVGRLNAAKLSHIQASMKMATPLSATKAPVVGLIKAVPAASTAAERRASTAPIVSFDEIRQLMHTQRAVPAEQGEADYDTHTLMDNEVESPYDVATVLLEEDTPEPMETPAFSFAANGHGSIPLVSVDEAYDEGGEDEETESEEDEVVHGFGEAGHGSDEESIGHSSPQQGVADRKALLAQKAQESADGVAHDFESETLKGVQRNKDAWRQMKVTMTESAQAGARAAAKRAKEGGTGFSAPALVVHKEVDDPPAAPSDTVPPTTPLSAMGAKERKRAEKELEKEKKKQLKAQLKLEKRQKKEQKKLKGKSADDFC